MNFLSQIWRSVMIQSVKIVKTDCHIHHFNFATNVEKVSLIFSTSLQIRHAEMQNIQFVANVPDDICIFA